MPSIFHNNISKFKEKMNFVSIFNATNERHEMHKRCRFKRKKKRKDANNICISYIEFLGDGINRELINDERVTNLEPYVS